MKYLLIIAALFAGVYFFSSCLKDNDNSFSAEENLKKGLEYLDKNSKREGVITTQSGLQYEVLTPGKENGKSPKASDMVRCHYKGTFIDGKTFDTSYGGNPLTFSLSGVISGWTEGLQYMTEGAKYRFVIPYQLGYGAYGYASIPPYSTLIFEVELIAVL